MWIQHFYIFFLTFSYLLNNSFSFDLKKQKKIPSVAKRLNKLLEQSESILRNTTLRYTLTDSKKMRTTSIVDSYNGERGRGNGGLLLYRRSQVFYAAIKVFADYKIVQWRCNQMNERKDEVVINTIWDQAHERNAKFLGDISNTYPCILLIIRNDVHVYMKDDIHLVMLLRMHVCIYCWNMIYVLIVMLDETV